MIKEDKILKEIDILLRKYVIAIKVNEYSISEANLNNLKFEILNLCKKNNECCKLNNSKKI
jgi:hypothetical protein